MYLNLSVNKYSIILILALLLSGCKKQIVTFDNQPNENFELSKILNLNGKDCVYDAELNILKYSINEATLINFSPVVKFENYSQVTFENTPLINHSQNNLGDLELNTPYEVSITTSGEVNVFTLIFTNLSIVQIISHDPIVVNSKTLSKMILHQPNNLSSSTENWAGIEYRGASSLQFDKKSYGIGLYSTSSLDYPISQPFFNFNTDQKWILNAMFVDKSRLRNKISFELWNSIPGPTEHVGIEMEYVEVFINREAKGLYAFSMKYTDEHLNLGPEAVLYEGIDNTITTTFGQSPEGEPSNHEWEGWEQKYPDVSQQIKWNDFKTLSQLISEGSDSQFSANIGNLLDLDNVIDYFLFINLCNGIDNVGKNWMFLKRDNTSKFNIVPWDLDGTWGRNPESTPLSSSLIITNNLFERLEELNPENYNTRLKQRWVDLRNSTFSDNNLSELINSNFDLLNETQIIPFENQLWQTSIDLDTEQNFINSWLSNRLDYLDDHFE